ncbi:MAG: hypothetical protein ACRDV4_00670, partial [Acidimicrobiales bacterium]
MRRRCGLGALVAAGLLAAWAASALVVLAPGGAVGASPIGASGRILRNTEPCSTPLSGPTQGPAVVSSVPTRFGPALVVGSGPYAGCSLYLLTSDAPANPKTYGCTGTAPIEACAVDAWPALLTTGRPMAGTGVNRTLLGTVTRTIGGHTVHQVTYAGHPLYRFSLDDTAGDTTGEQFFDAGTTPHGIWYLVSPGRGTPDAAPTTFADSTVPLVHTTTSYGTADVLTVKLDQGLGGLPFPVYTSSADMHDMSVCGSTADCALRWPAVLTSGRPMKTGTVGGVLGTVGRRPGMNQVTFNGQPLYVFNQDAYFPPTEGPPTFPHTIAAHGTGIHPTFTGLDVGTFSLVPAPSERPLVATGTYSITSTSLTPINTIGAITDFKQVATVVYSGGLKGGVTDTAILVLNNSNGDFHAVGTETCSACTLGGRTGGYTAAFTEQGTVTSTG